MTNSCWQNVPLLLQTQNFSNLKCFLIWQNFPNFKCFLIWQNSPNFKCLLIWRNFPNFKSFLIWQDEEQKLDELDKARLQKTSKVSRHAKDVKIDHSVIPVTKVLTVEDGLENPLTGVAIYLLRTSTKRTLGEETFQREIMCGMLNAQVKNIVGRQKLRGFVCTFHLAAQGLNPKHTIYTFSICIIEIWMRKRRKNEKEAVENDGLCNKTQKSPNIWAIFAWTSVIENF